MMQASYEYRCQILDNPLPATAPRFGDRVLIQKPLPHHSFQSKVEEGRFLTWDTTTLQGALVATVRHGALVIVPSSAPLPWPKEVNNRNQKWTLVQKPNSRERVWLGSLGGVIWDGRNEQMKGELVTFEERTCPRIPGDMLQEKIDNLRKGTEEELQYFVHGIVTERTMDPNKTQDGGNDETPALQEVDEPETKDCDPDEQKTESMIALDHQHRSRVANGDHGGSTNDDDENTTFRNVQCSLRRRLRCSRTKWTQMRSIQELTPDPKLTGLHERNGNP